MGLTSVRVSSYSARGAVLEFEAGARERSFTVLDHEDLAWHRLCGHAGAEVDGDPSNSLPHQLALARVHPLRELDGPDFESFLEVLFTRMGYDVVVTGGSGDDGIDLVAELTGGIAPQRVGIQAKAKGSPRQIGPNVVRLLRDALSTRECSAGAVVATVTFNADARRVAEEPGKPPVSLIGPAELTALALDFKVGVDAEPLELFQENLDGVFEPVSPKQSSATEDTLPKPY